MNKNSNTYTIVYISCIVVAVGAILALAAMVLKPLQQHNADADKMKQILASVHITPAEDSVIEDFGRYITAQYVVDVQGRVIGRDAFGVDVAAQTKITDAAQRRLPIYKCTLSGGETKYIIPAYGAGLWGPIWGYIALDADGSTVYGAYFSHQGETPGLGAEIQEPWFSGQFEGKQLFHGSEFVPIQVLKKGRKPTGGADYVDAVSGGTITSKGVSVMLDDCLRPYKVYLESLRDK